MTLKQLLEQARIAADQNNQIAVIDVPADEAEGVGEPVVILFGFGKQTRNDIVRLLNTFLAFETGGEEVKTNG